MARGGYRKPTNPSPVSGVGAGSRRTDGGAGSKQAQREIRTGRYGESKKIAEQQQGAPMAGAAAPIPPVNVPAMPQATPLFSKTQRPSEPVTQGMPFGAGDNNVPQRPSGDVVSVVGKYLPTLEELAAQDDAPDSFRTFVRAVRANVNYGVAQ